MKTVTSNIVAKEMTMNAFKVLQEMQNAPDAPDWLKSFNPLSGHTPSTRQEGKSWFDREYTVDEIRELMLNANPMVKMQIKDGPHACIALELESEVTIGWNAVTAPDTEGVFEIRRNHGELQVFGPASLHEVPTNTFTVILTPEKTGLALASVHPGTIDEDPDMEGLKEGDKLSFDQLIPRRIIRINKI